MTARLAEIQRTRAEANILEALQIELLCRVVRLRREADEMELAMLAEWEAEKDLKSARRHFGPGAKEARAV